MELSAPEFTAALAERGYTPGLYTRTSPLSSGAP